ncbi:hypothetical protein [Halorhodospira halochloris]|uniref:hypothetical protein n=1 Tax=Halorhodospira halochloris TaxID=1052 RepID=UPI001EE8B714|nr:hypothetical protein [Halorhodospira halochloris]MCG5547989.1 hypothetical protein [Halorhodospira halochloris]
MTLFAIVVLILLLALREVCSNRIRRLSHAQPHSTRRWRIARSWHTFALGLAAAAFLPTFVQQPELPILSEAHSLLNHTWPLFLLASGASVGLAIRIVNPQIKREIRRRQASIERRNRAQYGMNPERLSRGLRMWILDHGPAFDYRFDVETPDGVGNIVIGAEEGNFMIYVLPAEHAREGYATALQRSSKIAEHLDARGIVWIPDDKIKKAQTGDEHLAFVMRGSIVEVFRWIERTNEARRRNRERQEQRRNRALRSAQGEGIQWGSITEAEAMKKHDREAWERFARKTPIHPDMRDRVYRRHGARCAYCGFTMDPGRGQWEVIVSDYDHICRYPAKTRLVPYGIKPATSYEMPDCEQCHIEAPGHFEACISRLAPIHTRCKRERQEGKQDTAAD